MTIVLVAEEVRHAMERPGPTVVLDATVDVELLRLAVSSDIHVEDVRAADGAAIQREMIYVRGLNRRQCCPRGRPVWHDGLLSALRALFVRLAREPWVTNLGLVTFKGVADVLRRLWDAEAEDGELHVAWELLHCWREGGRTLGFLHYGASRGLDDLKTCDALATLGDPWPNKIAFQARCDFLEVGEAWKAHYWLACRAELEQAQGRLRAPHREKRGLAIHLGAVPPGGWGKEARVLRLPRGRRVDGSAMSAEALRAWRDERNLSLRDAAQVLGVASSTLHRYETGERPVPKDVADAVEAEPELTRRALNG